MIEKIDYLVCVVSMHDRLQGVIILLILSVLVYCLNLNMLKCLHHKLKCKDKMSKC
jgi:hypothetical protein